jgi:hypothetical protein
MPEKLKQKILEFVDIAKECPEALQTKCFELLLADYLEQSRRKVAGGADEPKAKNSKEGGDKDESITIKQPQQQDIAETDLHVKARQFLKKSGLTVDNINQMFYKEGDNFLPLYDDLKTTKGSESQIRIALLHSLVKGMHTGDFEFDGEAVREEAQVRKCYDATNFTANFNNNNELFESFSKYNKANSTVKLSTEGKTRLAQLIKDLQ